MKLTKKAQHAIEFAFFCMSWHYEPNDNFEEGYAWQDAKTGYLPIGRDEVTYLSTEGMYKRFLKSLNNEKAEIKKEETLI